MPQLSAQARSVALVVAAAFFMQMLDGVIIVTALPAMARDYGVEPLAMSIGVTIYMLATAIMIPSAGWLADRFGARRVFVVSIGLFTLASIACGMAANLEQFVAARAIQGAGGALMVPVGRIIVLRNAQKSEIVPAIGLIVWPALFAPVLGPLIGGFFTTYLTWHWNFWINIPLGMAGIALTQRIIPADGPGLRTPFDLLGFLLCGTSLAALLYAFEAFANGAAPTPVAAGLLALGLFSGTLALAWLRRRPHPLLDLKPIGITTFRAAEVTAGAALRLAINATPFLLPLLFQVGMGLDALQSGGLVVAYFLGNLAMKSVTTPILRRRGFRTVLVVNGLLAALSIALCGFLGSATPYWLIVAVLVFAGLTRSMQFTALATLAFADIDAERRSSASTLSSMFQQIAMTCSVALAAGVLNVLAWLHGAVTPQQADFRDAFFLMGAIALFASLAMLALSRHAGAEVSGHRPQGAAKSPVEMR